ncbi:hypothetical protein SIID45300_02689 [Candidatus Magnetaquicoccaceae bacterium FCR-1]|uniref:Polysaccharide biosynthesis protein n=1 Tax=Candidatus Magnetaquiglobus chichijimensis TaxID=3141448 RepID=A0ABQ0CBT6_9PROT
MYSILLSLTGWFALSDLGIGQALHNYLAERRAKHLPYSNYIIASAKAVAVLCIVIFIVSIIFSGLIWEVLSRKSGGAINRESGELAIVSIALISTVSVFGSLSTKIWFAEQRGYLANILIASSAILSAASVTLIGAFEFNNKLIAALLILNAPLAFFTFVSALHRIRHEFSLRSAEYENLPFRQLLERGSSFSAFFLLAAIVTQSDYFIQSQYCDPKQIAVYAILSKLFSIYQMAYIALLQAYAPIATASYAKNDWKSTNKITRTLIILSATGAVFYTAIIYFSNSHLTLYFTGGQFSEFPVDLIMLFGVLLLVRVWTDTYAMILQSASALKNLVFSASVQAIFSIALQLLLVPDFGPSGTIWALIISWVSTVAWLLPVLVTRLQKP